MSRKNISHAISGITTTLNKFVIKYIAPQYAKPSVFLCGMKDKVLYEYKTTGETGSLCTTVTTFTVITVRASGQ
jgi:hypothetical protein